MLNDGLKWKTLHFLLVVWMSLFQQKTMPPPLQIFLAWKRVHVVPNTVRAMSWDLLSFSYVVWICGISLFRCLLLPLCSMVLCTVSFFFLQIQSFLAVSTLPAPRWKFWPCWLHRPPHGRIAIWRTSNYKNNRWTICSVPTGVCLDKTIFRSRVIIRMMIHFSVSTFGISHACRFRSLISIKWQLVVVVTPFFQSSISCGSPDFRMKYSGRCMTKQCLCLFRLITDTLSTL